jgi:hypothetical protein
MKTRKDFHVAPGALARHPDAALKTAALRLHLRSALILAVAILAIAPVMRANDDKPAPTSATSTSVSSVNAPATANANAPATQSLVDQSVNVNPHQAPSVWAPEAFSTSSCRNGYSGGGSFLTGAATIGFTRTDHECEKRAAADAFEKIGRREDAFLLLCELKVSRNLKDCKHEEKKRHE